MIERIILASSSPRRIELVGKLPYEFISISPNADERFNEEKSPEENLIAVSHKKAQAVFESYELSANEVILSADTVVCLDEEVLTKPTDEADAVRMLKALSGVTHRVISGVSLKSLNREISFTEETTVEFAQMDIDEIERYVKSGECFDKAGAYAIQGEASLFIKRINGCYYNVMGLPLAKTYYMLKNIFGD